MPEADIIVSTSDDEEELDMLSDESHRMPLVTTATETLSGSVFVVTTFKSTLPRSRTVGIFLSLEDAKRPFVKNEGELSETGYYDVGIIEELPTGLYPLAKSRCFYRYCYETGVWIETTNPPDRFRGHPEVTFCQIG